MIYSITLIFFFNVVINYFLDTDAKKPISFSKFILRPKLTTFPTKTNHLILADDLKVAATAESLNIVIRLGHLDCKIKVIVWKKFIDIIAKLNWLRQLKPVIKFDLLNQLS